MPNNADEYAVDTSVAVAALDAGHAAHAVCRAVVIEHRPALAGHAAFETFAVLTRMPGRLAIDPPTAAAVIEQMYPTTCWLDPEAAGALLSRCGPTGIAGGAVYDALVGEAARVHGRRLLTRDLRARRTYDLLGVDHQLVG
jgi:predicted nucleic acid-binding protein